MEKFCLKSCLTPNNHCNRVSIALLIVRIVVGAAFIFHGWGKIQSPFNWMGPDAAVPGIFQFLAALSEFGGGIALIIGLLTPIACFGLACTMAVAVHLHMIIMKDPFVNTTGGTSYELALVYFAISLLLIATGPGKYSLDSKVFPNKSC